MTETTEQKRTEPHSEFYMDLLDFCGDSNNNPKQPQRNLNEEPVKLSNPTIIRPKVISNSGTSTSIKKPRTAPRSVSHYSDNSFKPRSSVKKKPPPRPAPPKCMKSTAAQRLPKVPPSYSKVMEEDIRSCINAYSCPKGRTSSSRTISSASASKTSIKCTRSSVNPEIVDLVQLNTPKKANKEQASLNVSGVNITAKNVKQAGSAASFLNRNPKLAKRVVPSQYQNTVYVAGKTHDFVQTHQNDFKNLNLSQHQKFKQTNDLLGSIGSEGNNSKFVMSPALFTSSQNSERLEHVFHSSKPSKESENTKLKRPKKSQAPLQPVDFNAGWGDYRISAKPDISQINPVNTTSVGSTIMAENNPQSPSIPEPQDPPPALIHPNDSLPSFELEPQGIALMNYTARNSDEISFQSKDIIILLKDDNDRFYGKLGKGEGYFPKFCVDVLFPLPSNEEVGSKAVTDEHPQGNSIVDVNNLENIISTMSVTETDEISRKDLSSSSSASSSDSQMITTALYNYDGDTSAGDIRFQAGDKIRVISKVNSDWLYGLCYGVMGQFPAAFVDVVPRNIPLHDQLVNCPTVVLRVVTACYDFEAQADDELTFKVGDKINVIEDINHEWSRGCVETDPALKGIFPVAFVKPAENTSDVKVKALYHFDASSSDELSFKINDIITVVQKVNEDWIIGKLNNQEGLFPASFVKNHIS